jgi:hypothetical protein
VEPFGPRPRSSPDNQPSIVNAHIATGTSGSSNGFLYFVVGALFAGVIVLGIMFFNAERNDGPLERAAEAVSEATDEVGDAARNAN